MITVPEFDPTILPMRERDRSYSTDVPTTAPGVVLEVFTFHAKDQRQYVTHVRGVRLVEDGKVRTMSLLDFSTLRTLPAGARFSARSLHDAHRDALKIVSDLVVLQPEHVFTTVLSKTPRD